MLQMLHETYEDRQNGGHGNANANGHGNFWLFSNENGQSRV
jgi:hypothetical protein